MANTLSPFGFTPVRRLDGAAWTGNHTLVKIAAANTNKFYTGDVVKQLSTGYVDTAAAGVTNGIRGIFVGCEYLSNAAGRPLWSAQFPGADTSSDVIAHIVDDPWVVFKVQSGNGGPVTFASVGRNIDLNVGTGGSTLSGISGEYADFGLIGNTATLPFTIIDLWGGANLGTWTTPNTAGPPGGNGADPTTANNTILVGWNQQSYRVGLTGI